MKKAVQFGAGNIGRGFIGALLSEAGYHVVFADVNQAVIDKINQDKTYTVHVMDVELSQQKITNISGVLSNTDDVFAEIEQAEIVTTAVGLVVLTRIAPAIAEGIRRRKKAGNKSPLNVIACENAIRASSQLKKAVLDCLSEDEKEFVKSYVGFPDSAVDRIVPPVKSENFIDVVVEKYFEWSVEESGFVGGVPKINGMHTVANLMAYLERKLFTLNTGHAITSYLGYLKGYDTIDQSIADEKIYGIVKAAMQESGNGLIQKYGFDKEAHLNYIETIIKRFKNPYLKDEVSRVGREPLRKLSETDRLIKPLMTAKEYGFSVKHILMGIAAALYYDNSEDSQSVTLQNDIRQKGIRKTLEDASKLTDGTVLDQVEEYYKGLKEIIA